MAAHLSQIGIFVSALLASAFGLANQSKSFLERPRKAKTEHGGPVVGGQVLLATMTFPEDNLPLDVTVAHQIRMITQFPEKVQHIIVDNRPPWMEPVNRQEEILQSMHKAKVSSVRKVDYKVYDNPTYLQKFFKTGDASNSTKTLERAHDVSDISGQHMSSNTQGMFNFLEHCLSADSAVDLCVFLDPDIIVYRKEKGMIELAREIFAANEQVIALNPPTMCSAFAEQKTETCTLKKPGLLSQRYLILNRPRLTQVLPLKVPHEQFDVNFEHLFSEGMRRQGYMAAQRMVCEGAFAIHPYSSRWAHCRNKRENLNIERHSKLIAESKKIKLTGDYHSFDKTMVEGLKELISRVEAGKLAKPEDPWSVTNMCEDMCVSKDRIDEGLAW